MKMGAFAPSDRALMMLIVCVASTVRSQQTEPPTTSPTVGPSLQPTTGTPTSTSPSSAPTSAPSRAPGCTNLFQLPTGAKLAATQSTVCRADAGSRCDVACENGYTAVPGRAVSYICNGVTHQWEPVGGQAIQCVRTCTRASLITAIAQLDVVAPGNQQSYDFDDTFTLVCATGYIEERTIATNPMTCKGDNAWVGGRITCKPKACPFPPPYENTEIVADNSCNGLHGGRCLFRCSTGYTGTAQTLVCNDGRWTGRAPQCSTAQQCNRCEQPDLTCSRASLLAYRATSPDTAGYRDFNSNLANSFNHDQTVANPGCRNGYTAVASAAQSYRCTGRNQWSGGQTICVPKTCPLPPPGLNVEMFAHLVNRQDVCHAKEGGLCKFGCQEGYQGGATVGGVRVFRCTNTQWVLQARTSFGGSQLNANTRIATVFSGARTCSVEDCNRCNSNQDSCSGASLTALVAADNTARSGNGIATIAPRASYNYGDIADVIRCADGYVPFRPIIQYQCAGVNKWENGSALCVARSCPALNIPNSETATDVVNCRTTYGGLCQIACNPGYVNAGVQRAFSCNYNAAITNVEWSPALTSMQCGCPVLTPDQIDPWATQGCPASTTSSTCRPQCEAGFEPDVGVLSCNSTGHWVGNFKCIPILVFRTGPGLFFRSPRLGALSLNDRVTYEVIVGSSTNVPDPNETIVAPNGVKDADGSLRIDSVPSAPDDQWLTLSDRISGNRYRVLRMLLSTIDFENNPPLAVSSPQVVAQLDKLERGVNVWELYIQDGVAFSASGGIDAFTAVGGSGYYTFSGHGQISLGDTFDTWKSINGGTSYQLQGILNTPETVENRIHVVVVDREYGTQASCRLVFLSSRDLTTDVTNSTVLPSTKVLSSLPTKVFDVTELGTFHTQVTASGVLDTLERVCEPLDPPATDCSNFVTTRQASTSGTSSPDGPIPGSQGTLLCGILHQGDTSLADRTYGEHVTTSEHHYVVTVTETGRYQIRATIPYGSFSVNDWSAVVHIYNETEHLLDSQILQHPNILSSSQATISIDLVSGLYVVMIEGLPGTLLARTSGTYQLMLICPSATTIVSTTVATTTDAVNLTTDTEDLNSTDFNSTIFLGTSSSFSTTTISTTTLGPCERAIADFDIKYGGYSRHEDLVSGRTPVLGLSLPGGLTLRRDCTISGTVSGNFNDASEAVKQTRALVKISVDIGGEIKEAVQAIAFNIFPPVKLSIVRSNKTRCLGPGNTERGWDVDCLTELVNLNEEYSAELVITGGQTPYEFPTAGIDLPPGMEIQQIYQMKGYPRVETTSSLALGSLRSSSTVFDRPQPTDYSWQVRDAYPGSVTVGSSISFIIGVPDCDILENGPNGIPCNNSDGTLFEEMCEDTIIFDRQYECDCGGLRKYPERYIGFTNDTRGTFLDRYNTGDNCEIAPPPPPEAAAAEAEESDNTVIIIVALLFVILLVCAAIYMAYQRHLLNQPFDFEAEQKRMMAEGTLALAVVAAGGDEGEGPKMPEELKRSRITTLDKLGSGAFGDVNKGLYRPEMPGVPEFAVAIKVLKTEPTREEKDELMKEAMVTCQFDSDYVVMCIGVVTKGTPVMLVLQLCEKGSLHGLLKDEPSKEEKGHYCLDTAFGMEYLACLGFVHRDLAARNVLVDAKGTCKIADFGLSRDTEDQEYYVAKAGKVPIRWTSVEALTSRKFSEASDVWAYAITCIEIWTNAVTPYKGWMNAFVMEQVLDGYIHPCPEECPTNFYELAIKPSLQFKAKDRPTFKQLASQLREYFDGNWMADDTGPSGVPTQFPSYSTDDTNSTRYKDVSSHKLQQQQQRKTSTVSLKADAKPLDDDTLAVIKHERESVPYYHGWIDEDEAEDRLRKRGDGGADLTMTFMERKYYLIRDGPSERMIHLSVLYEGKYVHHTLMYGNDHKWKEHGKGKTPPLAMQLQKSIKQLLGSLPIDDGQLIPMHCPVVERGIKSVIPESFGLPWWSGTTEKDKIRAGILLGVVGTFTIRKSSKQNKVVLCVNDHGKMMEYLISWIPRDNKWTFIDGKYDSIEAIIDVLYKRPLNSKRGDDITISDIKPGGMAFNSMRALLWAWAGNKTKQEVKMAVQQGFTGDYMFRSSSRPNQIVWAVNDGGNCVDYQVHWDPELQQWQFVDQTFKTLREIINFVLKNPLASTTGGSDISLGVPAPGGDIFDVERELWGVIDEVQDVEPDSGADLPEEEEESEYQNMIHNPAPDSDLATSTNGRTEETFGFDEGNPANEADNEVQQHHDENDEDIGNEAKKSKSRWSFSSGESSKNKKNKVTSFFGFGRKRTTSASSDGESGGENPGHVFFDSEEVETKPKGDGYLAVGNEADIGEEPDAEAQYEDADDDGREQDVEPQEEMEYMANDPDLPAMPSRVVSIPARLEPDLPDGLSDLMDDEPPPLPPPVQRSAPAAVEEDFGFESEVATAWWMPNMPKSEISALVKSGVLGAYLVRPSSKANSVVLVVNDHGQAVNLPVSYVDGKWKFATNEYNTLPEMIADLHTLELDSKNGTPYVLTETFPGGEEWDEHAFRSS